jgi:type VI secretion system secreted protein Hcp
MAFDAFLKIETIPGESHDDKHKDWIEVLNYEVSVTQVSAGSRSSGGARTGGRADFADLSITHTIDKATPKLKLACANGEHIGKVILELCRATKDKTPYMVYKMENVIVTSVTTTGDAKAPDTPLPLEVVTFNYGKMTWTYSETDKEKGTKKGEVETMWDLIKNN